MAKKKEKQVVEGTMEEIKLDEGLIEKKVQKRVKEEILKMGDKLKIEAEKLIEDANGEVKKIISNGKNEAEKIVNFAKEESKKILKKALNESKPKAKTGIIEYDRNVAAKDIFRVKANNGEILMVSQAYKSKQGCRVGSAALMNALKNPKSIDLTVEKTIIKVK